MDKYSAQLDEVFVALADPTRRAVVRRLGRGTASIGELAREHPMTLPSFMKHIRMLERAGLVQTTKRGRVRTCRLDRDRLSLVDDWLEREREVWRGRADRLEAFVLDELERTDLQRTDLQRTDPEGAAPDRHHRQETR